MDTDKIIKKLASAHLAFHIQFQNQVSALQIGGVEAMSKLLDTSPSQGSMRFWMIIKTAKVEKRSQLKQSAEI